MLLPAGPPRPEADERVNQLDSAPIRATPPPEPPLARALRLHGDEGRKLPARNGHAPPSQRRARDPRVRRGQRDAEANGRSPARPPAPATAPRLGPVPH